MLPEISRIKGIHPGVILKRELKISGMKSQELAELVGEHKQTLSAILHGRRNINPGLSIKLGKELGVSADYFMLLQASYDVENEIKQRQLRKRTPDLRKIRKTLFWDTHFNELDWEQKKSAIIKRIFERGNETEILEIISFYGRPTVKRIVQTAKNNFLPSYLENMRKYLHVD